MHRNEPPSLNFLSSLDIRFPSFATRGFRIIFTVVVLSVCALGALYDYFQPGGAKPDGTLLPAIVAVIVLALSFIVSKLKRENRLSRPKTMARS